MMRAAPGHNYPRAGFPLEGRLQEPPGPRRVPAGPSRSQGRICEKTRNFHGQEERGLRVSGSPPVSNLFYANVLIYFFICEISV